MCYSECKIITYLEQATLPASLWRWMLEIEGAGAGGRGGGRRWGSGGGCGIWMLLSYIVVQICLNSIINLTVHDTYHTMDLLWEKFQWILPLYMKPISFQSKASVVCSVTAAIFIDFCLKKLNVFSQHIGQKTNEYLNSAEQIPRNWNVDRLSVLNTSWYIT